MLPRRWFAASFSTAVKFSGRHDDAHTRHRTSGHEPTTHRTSACVLRVLGGCAQIAWLPRAAVRATTAVGVQRPPFCIWYWQ